MSTDGTARGLFVKPAKSVPMRATSMIDLAAGSGIAGDANADPRSPRQVLLAAQESVRRLGLAPGALRENVCVGGMAVDELPSGTVLRLGSALLRVTFGCDPCALLRRYADIDPRRTTGSRGVLAIVISDGTCELGGSVADLGVQYDPLPPSWQERAAWFLQRLPAGAVMTYGDLATAVGQVASVARGLPRLLAGPTFAGLPTDRVLTAAQLGALPQARRWSFWDPLYAPRPVAAAT